VRVADPEPGPDVVGRVGQEHRDGGLTAGRDLDLVAGLEGEGRARARAACRCPGGWRVSENMSASWSTSREDVSGRGLPRLL
jgi:hypothetical protein